LETLRILIAEDHPLYRKGMISQPQSIPGFEVVGEAATGEEAVARSAQVQPDVILMDLQMPEVNGIEATRRIMRESPNVRVLMVTLFEDDESVFKALRAGARGYVLEPLHLLTRDPPRALEAHHHAGRRREDAER
jgi:DNA-binding NarL/FixJ family response regulator